MIASDIIICDTQSLSLFPNAGESTISGVYNSNIDLNTWSSALSDLGSPGVVPYPAAGKSSPVGL